jgi:hypothetical protein
MSDGYITGTLRDFGQVLHTDSVSTVVVSRTLPNVEGHWYAIGHCASSNDAGVNPVAGLISAYIQTNGGSASKIQESLLTNMGATGYNMYLTTNSLDVRVEMQAENGVRSVGMIEIFGVEMAI